MRRRRKKIHTPPDLRFHILTGFFFFICFIFVLRLFSIQVLQHEKYKAMAQDQYWSIQELPAKRGEILTRDLFPLATTQAAYLLYIEPKNIENKTQFVEKLSIVLSEISAGKKEKNSLSYYQQRLNELLKLDLMWIAVEHNLSPFDKEKIEALGLLGLGFEEEPTRYYPEHTLASHVLGFVASEENGGTIGYFGIEGKFNGDLTGKPGRVVEEKDAVGTPILVGGYKKVDPIDGRNVILTIDRSVQYIAEKKIKEGVINYGAASGSVIIMEPETGNILAMANYPTFDPGNFNYVMSEDAVESTQSYAPNKRNFSVAETYEPGSVIKALTVAAGIDLGIISPNTTFVDNGPVTYSGYTINNWDGKHHGVQTIVELLQKSNNIGSAWVGHQVGAKKLHEYFSEFGLGSVTGVDLEGEDSGFLRESEVWTDIDLATAAFGQGISATPLQVVNAFNAIANGGELMQPRIVHQVEDEGRLITIPPKSIRRVISEDSAETVTDMLVQAVEGGESKYFNIKDYYIAGKTGTAQIPKDGKYDPSETNATFVGFLSKSKKYTMIVRLDRPKSSVYAAETAVPLWMDITGELVKHYGIPPDKSL